MQTLRIILHRAGWCKNKTRIEEQQQEETKAHPKR